jgi:hypothetical protein
MSRREKEIMKDVTTAQAKLKKDEIYQIVFTAAIEKESALDIKEIYELINERLKKEDMRLSKQGEASLRALINKTAVQEGYLFQYDNSNPGWRITPEARGLIEEQGKQSELVFNQETQREENIVPNTVRGALFEKYCLELLKRIYPNYAWFHQGVQKNNERGLDLIAERIGDIQKEDKSIGVQIKNHKENTSPTEKEWLKYMAGCFTRRIDKAIFITTGKLTSEQRREAGEEKILVIEGTDEIQRIAKCYNYKEYEEF